MTSPGEAPQKTAAAERVLYYDLPNAVAETTRGEIQIKAEFYLPGVMRVAHSRAGLLTAPTTVVNLRNLAFAPMRVPYRQREFLETVDLGKELLGDQVDFDAIPAGYPEIGSLVTTAMSERPLVPLADLTPGQYYLHTHHARFHDTRKAVSHGVFRFDRVERSDDRGHEMFSVMRDYDSQFGWKGHIAFLPDWGWLPVDPMNKTTDMTETGRSVVTFMWNEPDIVSGHHFQEVTADEVGILSALRPVVMRPKVEFSTGSVLA
jgi:hypothetical protein